MKKLRFVLLSIAVLSGICIAWATSAKAPCDAQTQYYYSGGNYYPAGIEGYDYVCAFDHFSTCTYYYYSDRIGYLSCKSGKLLWLR